MADKNVVTGKPTTTFTKNVKPTLGFRAPVNFGGSKFSQRGQQKASFNPTMFRQTQHKG